MKVLRFFEYGGYSNSAGIESDALATCSLSNDEILFLKRLSETMVPGKAIFDITSSTIRATSMVGIVSFGSVQIEVLPKLLKNKKNESESATASILKNLMFMLSYTNALDIKDTGIGSLGAKHESFIEACISIYANRLSRYLIRFGSPKAYVEQSENLTTIRGKIAFAKQSTINSLNQARVYCDYSEFTIDNSLTRAFKFVSIALARLTRDSASLTLLNRCIGLLDGVQLSYVNPQALERITIGKRDPNFISLINLTGMFLKRLRPEFSDHVRNKVFGLVFDMNELFEEFIYQALKRNETFLEIEVTAQKRKRLVNAERDFLSSGEWVDRSLFDTFTDISIKPKIGPEFIIDTKYKIIGSAKNHYGISNQDAYQVLAYRQIHKNDVSDPTVALLYPKFSEDLQKEFRVNGSNTSFMAWTIDISMDLESNMQNLVGNLKKLIECANPKTKKIAL